MSLLPPNATPLEQCIAASAAPAPAGLVPTLWDPATCPAHLLHVLAWAEGVYYWDAGWDDSIKRAAISASRALYSKHGTPSAIREVFRALNLGEVDIQEGRSGYRRNGAQRRDGFPIRAARALHWAEYRIVCHTVLSIEQASMVRAALAIAGRNCAHLYEINFQGAALIRNGVARRDGTFTRGIV